MQNEKIVNQILRAKKLFEKNSNVVTKRLVDFLCDDKAFGESIEELSTALKYLRDGYKKVWNEKDIRVFYEMQKKMIISGGVNENTLQLINDVYVFAKGGKKPIIDEKRIGYEGYVRQILAGLERKKAQENAYRLKVRKELNAKRSVVKEKKTEIIAEEISSLNDTKEKPGVKSEFKKKEKITGKRTLKTIVLFTSLLFAGNFNNKTVQDDIVYSEIPKMPISVNYENELSKDEVDSMLVLSGAMISLINSNETPALGEKIVSQAMTYLGKVQYRLGAKPEHFNPYNARLDCSGFVRKVLEDLCGTNLNQTLGEVTLNQINQDKISELDLQPGDLAFVMKSNGKVPCHVAIYAGYGLYIHCSGTYEGVGVTRKSYIDNDGRTATFTEFRRLNKQIRKMLEQGKPLPPPVL